MLPTLQTSRLILRPFRMEDARDVQRLAGDPQIADTTTSMLPQPYLDGMAEEWIATHHEAFESGQSLIFAITLRDVVDPEKGGELVGAIELRIQEQGRRGEFGYWVAVPHWNRGYCTEAVIALIDHGFGTLALHRITAYHYTRNPASGRVMAKAGLRHEAHLREHALGRGTMEDIEVYGILRREWEAAKSVDPGI